MLSLPTQSLSTPPTTLAMRVGSAMQSPLQTSWPRSERERRRRRQRKEEADAVEDSPGEGQGGRHQQTDTGHEAKTQGNKDRALASR